jgi:acetolactate synthase small subunit
MTDEDRQRTMDFILAQQAQFSVNMGVLRESQARTDEAVSRLSIQVEQLTTQVQSIARQQEHINEVVAVIADAQPHADERLNVLIGFVEKGRNGQS